VAWRARARSYARLRAALHAASVLVACVALLQPMVALQTLVSTRGRLIALTPPRRLSLLGLLISAAGARARTHTNTCARTHKHLRAHTQTPARARAHVRTACARVHAHAHAHATCNMHMHARACTCHMPHALRRVYMHMHFSCTALGRRLAAPRWRRGARGRRLARRAAGMHTAHRSGLQAAHTAHAHTHAHAHARAHAHAHAHARACACTLHAHGVPDATPCSSASLRALRRCCSGRRCSA